MRSIRFFALACLLSACGAVERPFPEAEVIDLDVTPDDPNAIPAGLDVQLTATATRSDGTEEDVTAEVTWSTSDDGVATVSDGLVTGVAVGDVEITATMDGISDTVSITVGNAELVSIAIDPPTGTVRVAGQTQFTAIATYTDDTVVDVTAQATWDSSDDALAAPSTTSGEEGLFVGNMTGTTGSITVTATFDGESDTSAVMVEPAILGTHPTNPGDDCTAVRAAGPDTDGIYWIDPDGDDDNTDAFQAYCDMTTDGGGWTLLSFTDSISTAPYGIPFPGLVPCADLTTCTRGSAAADPQAEELIRRSTEFGLGSNTAAGESVKPLGSFEHAGKYVYGPPMANIDLNYGPSTCIVDEGFNGQFRNLVGPATDNTPVYLSTNLTYSTGSYDYSSDANSYIFQIGVPLHNCNGNGAVPGSWSGTWSTTNYGPAQQYSGARALFVRGGTVPSNNTGQYYGSPGTSCANILASGGSTGDGIYWIDPQATGTPFRVRCDMTTDGGGWTITYDADAPHFDGSFINNLVASSNPPTRRNVHSDIWNAEAVMTVSETLFACGQQNNAASFYWRYDTAAPHTFLANTDMSYEYQNSTATAASSGTAGGCMSVHKAEDTYGFVSIQPSGCGGCSNIAFGMYHYTTGGGCNSTSTTYGAHLSPWDNRSIQYPICNGQQTSNGRFWMAVR